MITSLPPIAIQRIGTFLGTKDRNAARCAATIFKDIHTGSTEHELYFDRHSMPVFAKRCHVASQLMPCLNKITIVFKNLVGPPQHVEAGDLDGFTKCPHVEIAFEYCDEEFMTAILCMPWRLTFAFLWFHNGTETPVVESLKVALHQRGNTFNFASRFNSKQAPSLLTDERIINKMKEAHYVVHANHFDATYGHMAPPHVINIPLAITRAHVELFHYNVIVEHPEKLVSVSFAALNFTDGDTMCSNRQRLASWFAADSLRDGALQSVDIYSLSFSQSFNSTTCFAHHIFRTLRAIKSTAVVRIYNCLQSQCMALLQQYPDIFVVLICKTDHSYLVGHIVMCFLKHARLRLVIEDTYQPRPEWRSLNLSNPKELFKALPPVLQHDWHWVSFT